MTRGTDAEAARNHERNAGTVTRRRTSRGSSCPVAMIAVILLLSIPIIVPVSGTVSGSHPEATILPPVKSDSELMVRWANQLVADHPEMATMSKVEKAKFIFAQYSQGLRDAQAGVNSNRVSRLKELFGSLDISRYSCDWHTKSLDTIYSTLGFYGATHELVADKTSAQTLVTLDPNRNHGALLLVIDGTPYIFDAWKMAVDNNGEYLSADDLLSQNGDTGIYDGMSVDDWNRKMVSEGYERFTVLDDPDTYVWSASPADAIDAIPHYGPANSAIPATSPTYTPIPTTNGFGNGLRMITITSQDADSGTKTFTVPDGSRATGFKATYDFSSTKPGMGGYFEVSLASDKTLWSTRVSGEGWGPSSGTTETEGSLDNLILGPGTYTFASIQRETSPYDTTSPLPATLTYTVSNSV